MFPSELLQYVSYVLYSTHEAIALIQVTPDFPEDYREHTKAIVSDIGAHRHIHRGLLLTEPDLKFATLIWRFNVCLQRIQTIPK